MDKTLTGSDGHLANDPLIIAVLADSRGLDTYYLNSQYPEGYGIDRVFVPGRSILDTAFNVGWEGAADLVKGAAGSI